MVNGEIIKQDDALWKGMVEDLFADFIRFFYPNDYETFDLQHFDFLDKELQKMYPDIETGTDRRFVDKLVKARRKTGKEQWILVHIEIQGYDDEHFAERMFTYWSRVHDRYKQPITAIAIFTDAKGKMPDHYKLEELGTRMEYRYNTYRICDQPDDKLKESKNPFAMIVMAAKTALLNGKMADAELMSRHEWAYQALEGIGLSEDKKKSIHAFLRGCLNFADSETSIIFGKKADQITGKTNVMGVQEYLKEQGRQEGREEGRQEGREEEKTSLVKRLLADQFAIAKICDLVGVNEVFVRKIEKGIIVERGCSIQ